jgi:hypothetical protein
VIGVPGFVKGRRKLRRDIGSVRSAPIAKWGCYACLCDKEDASTGRLCVVRYRRGIWCVCMLVRVVSCI